MIYPFLTLEDGTEIVHSDMQEDGRVKVYIEKPDAEYCFCHATCWLPDYSWEDIYMLSDAEIDALQEIIRSSAGEILEAARKARLENRTD